MSLRRLVRNHRYEAIAFLTGAAVMMLEIVGARLIAPHFGTSTYVWTAMIGVILGALAAGYAVGGRLADRDGAKDTLPLIIAGSALLILIVGLTQQSLLTDIAGLNLDLRISALLSALLLFAPPSFLIGMVSPHLAKIRIVSLETSGKSVGRLEAAGALGSIAGTFACGYVLLGLIGSRAIVVGVVVLLVAAALLAGPRRLTRLHMSLVVGAMLVLAISFTRPGGVLADIDSAYARYKVVEMNYGVTPVHALVTDNLGIQSASSTTNPYTPVFSYITKFYVALFNIRETREVRSILVIGGGTYTFPSIVTKTMPGINVSVVEIDPALEELAQDYFYLHKTPDLRIINEDGRTYLNRNQLRHDVIFLDAYSSNSPPFQLATREMILRTKQSLKSDGIVVSNVISTIQGSRSDYLEALKATYEREFKYVEFCQADGTAKLENIQQNFIIIASDSAEAVATTTSTGFGKALQIRPGGLTLTDDFAPIEKLSN